MIDWQPNDKGYGVFLWDLIFLLESNKYIFK